MSYRAKHIKELKQGVIGKYNEDILSKNLKLKYRRMSLEEFNEDLNSESLKKCKEIEDISSKDYTKRSEKIKGLMEIRGYRELINNINHLVEIKELDFPEDASLEYIIDVIKGQFPK